jgi:hypothetical protein
MFYKWPTWAPNSDAGVETAGAGAYVAGATRELAGGNFGVPGAGRAPRARAKSHAPRVLRAAMPPFASTVSTGDFSPTSGKRLRPQQEADAPRAATPGGTRR